MKKIRKLNVVLMVEDKELPHYLSNGFKEVDDKKDEGKKTLEPAEKKDGKEPKKDEGKK